MGLLEKIENFINGLLIKFGELTWRLCPKHFKIFINQILNLYSLFLLFIKQSPQLLLKTFKLTFKWVSSKLSFFRRSISENYQKYKEVFKAITPPGAGKFKTFLLLPWFLASKWLRGLTAAQTFLLLFFTFGSTLAIIGIGFSGKRVLRQIESSRAPASQEEITYDRPDYYKKQTKHVQITNLRLPVYFAKVNEIKTVDIDFVATMNNRHSKMFLEKHDFQFRDHVILQMEPSVASFPLEEEGKEIIRQKLIKEINLFLIKHNIEGEVLEVKITFVLAN